MTDSSTQDLRLIEHGFPCHQVGAETRRERNASSALPPLYFLHVWWARRPLTPSRAAILASILPSGYDSDTFLKLLGIRYPSAEIDGYCWRIPDEVRHKIVWGSDETGRLVIDRKVATLFEEEKERCAANLRIVEQHRQHDTPDDAVLRRWEYDNGKIPNRDLVLNEVLTVRWTVGDPDWANRRIDWEKANKVRTSEDKYGYSRPYEREPEGQRAKGYVVLDPTSGGGSIPFMALREGAEVIANELNPVASIILHATLEYPARFGPSLTEEIEKWGDKLIRQARNQLQDLFPASKLPDDPEKLETLDGFLYVRTVTCPHCSGVAPLLNTCWLAKEAGDQWGVRVLPQADKSVRFETYRAKGGRGPDGEDPEVGTVMRGTGMCVHCKQAISGDEIKAQARGESTHGKWRDLLYTVVAVRREPVLDAKGNPARYASGERKGEIKTRKVRFFRPPNERDMSALADAERRLQSRWNELESLDLIPTEQIPEKSNYNRGHRLYGMSRWCDLFTPRQLLCHLTSIQELRAMKQDIITELGAEKGRAVITYLQFAIDKALDYNSSQTRWEFTRGIIKGCFSRHNFSLQWTFGEMIFTGLNSGAEWGLSQVLDAYHGIAKMAEPVYGRVESGERLPLRIINGTAAHMAAVKEGIVDVICMDPPYYDNVQYAELSDYFYVWQKRTLSDLYPEIFTRRLANKEDEAVANPARDGGTEGGRQAYERMMREIFTECHRVLKNDGILTMMFTHKTQEAWEALTRALIETGWTITASFPVDSESTHSTHQMDVAAAASSIFIACRKRATSKSEAAVWSGFGGIGVQQRIRSAVKEGLKDFAVLRLNPVDEMVASYGRALRVLSENWPVLDGDVPVSPVRAMNEASSVVAQNQVSRITQGQLSVDDLQSEAAMALTLFGIFGTAWFAFDEALNLSKSLNIRLESKPGGYEVSEAMIGINAEERANVSSGDKGYFAPIVRKGAKLRLALPEERNPKRLEKPRTDWDLLHGLIVAYRRGDIPVARAYLSEHAQGREEHVQNLLAVWQAEIGDPKLAKEAAAIRFGLRNV